MTGMKWSRLAQADLAQIDEYYQAGDPDFADLIGHEAIRAARFLLANPDAGVRTGLGEVRKWPVPNTPYLLFYRRDGSDIRILRVRHNRQNWKLPQ
ncbi:MAG TPA: type II toxin-antitoxin system RelE/ParE family toxin [Rhizorhapis sp.]|nr:type II toxin-antitoxin system RelE/ParE family toxin [Rhizorhapis sp.]